MPDAISMSVVLIVSYTARPILADCLASLYACNPDVQVVIVDNASADDTRTFLREHYPQVDLLESPQNLGFAGGNNLGFAHIRRNLPQVKYVALLNQDTLVEPCWLEALVDTLETNPTAASAQSRLRLHPETDLLNSSGNCSHYLGFGFTGGYREKDTGTYDSQRDLAFCSGAAMLVRVADVPRDDLFDPFYFCYLEDAELGWYFRLQGKQNLFCPASVVYHRYQFKRNPGLYYRLERNRWRLILSYYHPLTLLVLLPMLWVMEGGLVLYFLRAGALKEKWRSWDVLFSGGLRQARRRIQAIRQVSDRQLTRPFISRVTFSEIRNPLLDYLGNPLLRIYWQVIRAIMFW